LSCLCFPLRNRRFTFTAALQQSERMGCGAPHWQLLLYVSMYTLFGGTSIRAYTRTQQTRGATPELQHVADITSHGLSAGRRIPPRTQTTIGSPILCGRPKGGRGGGGCGLFSRSYSTPPPYLSKQIVASFVYACLYRECSRDDDNDMLVPTQGTPPRQHSSRHGPQRHTANSQHCGCGHAALPREGRRQTPPADAPTSLKQKSKNRPPTSWVNSEGEAGW